MSWSTPPPPWRRCLFAIPKTLSWAILISPRTRDRCLSVLRYTPDKNDGNKTDGKNNEKNSVISHHFSPSFLSRLQVVSGEGGPDHLKVVGGVQDPPPKRWEGLSGPPPPSFSGSKNRDSFIPVHTAPKIRLLALLLSTWHTIFVFWYFSHKKWSKKFKTNSTFLIYFQPKIKDFSTMSADIQPFDRSQNRKFYVRGVQPPPLRVGRGVRTPPKAS